MNLLDTLKLRPTSIRNLPGLGRFETYVPPDGGETFYQLVLSAEQLRRTFESGILTERRRFNKLSNSIANLILRMPREARGRTVVTIAGAYDREIVRALIAAVLFGNDEKPSMWRAAQILTYLLDDTPYLLDGQDVQGSLMFLWLTLYDVSLLDLPRVWSVREEIFEKAGVQDSHDAA